MYTPFEEKREEKYNKYMSDVIEKKEKKDKCKLSVKNKISYDFFFIFSHFFIFNFFSEIISDY